MVKINKKNIFIFLFIIIFILLAIVLVKPATTHIIVYYCTDGRYSECDYFDQHYGLDNGECVINNSSNKRCITGWNINIGG